MFSTSMLQNGNLSFIGRLDASQADNADKVLSGIFTSSTLDFKDLDYISSAGLGVLLEHQKRLRENGQALKLIHVNKHIREIFEFTGFDSLFEIEENR